MTRSSSTSDIPGSAILTMGMVATACTIPPSPAGIISYDAVPYARLVGNSYSVRVGPDHKVGKLIGHDDFLRHCHGRCACRPAPNVDK